MDSIVDDALKGTEGALDSLVEAILPKFKETIVKAITEDREQRIKLLVKTLFNEHFAELEARIKHLENENHTLTIHMNDQQAYSRMDNLIFHGIKYSNYSDAAAVRGGEEGQANDNGPFGETSLTAEAAVIALCNQKLGVPISPADISIAHRLGGSRAKHTEKKTHRPKALGTMDNMAGVPKEESYDFYPTTCDRQIYQQKNKK